MGRPIDPHQTVRVEFDVRGASDRVPPGARLVCQACDEPLAWVAGRLWRCPGCDYRMGCDEARVVLRLAEDGLRGLRRVVQACEWDQDRRVRRRGVWAWLRRLFTSSR